MKKSGFTLIELLVVIAIIGVLSTLGIVAINVARNKAKVAKAQHDIDVISQAIATLANDTNVWPGPFPDRQVIDEVCSALCPNNRFCGPDADNNNCGASTLDSGLAGLTQNDGANPYDGWLGPYMEEIPLDAWNHEYFFYTDYLVHIDNTPCDDGDVTCVRAAVVGSYGPDGLGMLTITPGDLADDVIKVIAK